MTVYSGDLGMIDGQVNVRNWSIDEGFASNVMVHSGTRHGTDRENGPYDWTGSFDVYGAIPVWKPGDIVALDAYKAPDATGDEDNGEHYEGNIYIESIAININFQTNEVINHQVTFGGVGALNISAGVPIVDPATPANKTPCAGRLVTYVAPGAVPADETIVPHVTTVTLTLTRPAVTSVNSGSSAGVNKCLTVRVPGAALDWTMTVATEEGNANALLQPGTNHLMRLYIDNTLCFDFKWAHLATITGLTVDVESGAIISQTYNFEMKATLSGVLGEVKTPGPVTLWPAP